MVSSWKLDSSTTKTRPGGPSTTAGERHADVAADLDRDARRAREQRAGQRGGGALAVVPVIADDRAVEEREGELDLGDHRHARARRAATSSGWSSGTPG